MSRLFVLVLLGIASGNSLACKCANSSLGEEFAQAPIAFVGSTTSDPSRPGNFGDTISFVVARSLKGGFDAGASVAVDPMFGSDCTAPYFPGARLLVFAYPQRSGAPIVNACSIRATEPVRLGQDVVQPSQDVLDFLRSMP